MRLTRIITADDNEGMRLVMRKLVEKCEGYEHVGEAKDGDELMALFEKEKPDVVLMDVEMPGKTGVECARLMKKARPETALVFATAHEEYMKSAFEVYAFDYLVKPFSTQRALNTLNMIRDKLPKPEIEKKPAARRLMLKHREGVSVIDLAQIVLIQREERASVIYTEDGAKYVTGDTLNELDERLPDDMFFRTHKSYIVSLSHIASISPYGRWTYIVKLRGTKLDALITHERYETLGKMFD